MEIRIPNLSDGVTSGTVVSVLVSSGDKVEKEQTIIELETDKAVAPIPATDAGTVSQVLVKEGDTVNVGQAIVVLEGGAPASETPAPDQKSAPASPAPSTPSAAPTPLATSPGSFQYQSPTGAPPPASPSVRRMARDLGIDLTRVPGSEAGGRISLADVRLYIQQLQMGAVAAPPPPQQAAVPAPSEKPKAESIDFSKYGPVRKEKMSSLRKTIADRMTESWQTIPHITQFDEADMTNLLALRKKLVKDYEKKGVKLTVTALIIKAVVVALKKFPLFNASIDEATQEIVYKDYFHLGIAVDTDAGLIVPVLKDADKKDLVQISKDLSTLAEKARTRKVTMDDLKGGSFTISNLGGIGGTHFTPIINKPEVAILALCKGFEKVKMVDKKPTPRMVMPVGVSYDHRVIDGANGARFIVAVSEAIENLSEKDLGAN